MIDPELIKAHTKQLQEWQKMQAQRLRMHQKHQITQSQQAVKHRQQLAQQVVQHQHDQQALADKTAKEKTHLLQQHALEQQHQAQQEHQLANQHQNVRQQLMAKILSPQQLLQQHLADSGLKSGWTAQRLPTK